MWSTVRSRPKFDSVLFSGTETPRIPTHLRVSVHLQLVEDGTTYTVILEMTFLSHNTLGYRI